MWNECYSPFEVGDLGTEVVVVTECWEEYDIVLKIVVKIRK
jgi:hypothetical protein